MRTILPTPIDNVITKSECRNLFAKAKANRAGGPDGIIDDFCRIAPEEMARLYHPLLIKAQLAAVEPISHKGGWQTYFAKSSTAKPDLGGRRMILLNNIIAKHRHRFLRGRLKTITAQLLRDSRRGQGRTGAPTS